ncbi:MAG: serine/threonine-protein kinase [Gemmatimonadota bacterium]
MSESLEDLAKELAPDLELIRPIGRGSVAHVYLAREPGLKRLVAVKVLRRELASDEVARKRFEREAQAAARINHPHITDIYRIGHLADGVPYIVMEYIDGRTIADAVRARGALSVDEVKGLLADLASALAAAHEHLVVHRDVRPSNIMRESANGRTVLMDFGIAGLLESGSETITRLTAQGVRLGDLRYMSPEQMRGETVTPQTDIYSIGVVGFELLTGESPFGNAPGVQAMAAQLRGERRSLSELRPDLDRRLADLIDRCLAAAPEQRPNARDLLKALATGPADRVEPVEEEVARGPVGAFIAELKRRRVYTVSVGYLLATVAILEAANNMLFDPGILPQGLYRVIAIIATIGFPIAVVLAWVFDIHGGRISRTAALPGSEARDMDRPVRRVLPWAALGVTFVVSILLGAWLLSRH